MLIAIGLIIGQNQVHVDSNGSNYQTGSSKVMLIAIGLIIRQKQGHVDSNRSNYQTVSRSC